MRRCSPLTARDRRSTEVPLGPPWSSWRCAGASAQTTPAVTAPNLRVLLRRAGQDASDLVPQLPGLQHLDVLAPGEDPQPDLDDTADGRAPQQPPVGASLRPLQGMPGRFEHA